MLYKQTAPQLNRQGEITGSSSPSETIKNHRETSTDVHARSKSRICFVQKTLNLNLAKYYQKTYKQKQVIVTVCQLKMTLFFLNIYLCGAN